jgi:hypothetical protein
MKSKGNVVAKQKQGPESTPVLQKKQQRKRNEEKRDKERKVGE